MEQDARRTIIEAVASGTLSPEEAVDQLEEAPETSTEPVRLADPEATIRVQIMSGGPIEIVGDAAVPDVQIEGPGRKTELERNGDDVPFFVETGSDSLVRVNPFVNLVAELHGESAELRGLRGTLQLECHVGSLAVAAELRRGHSGIEAHCGDIDLELAPSSDIRITLRAPTSLSADPEFEATGRGEWTLGSGTADLVVDGHIGHVHLSTT
jgi:hypothetical protein